MTKKGATMNTLEKILKLIKDSSLSDKTFEDTLGIPNRTVNDWKRGKSESYMKKLPEIAKLFGISADYLLGLTDELAYGKPDYSSVTRIAEKLGSLSELNRLRVEGYIDAIIETASDIMTAKTHRAAISDKPVAGNASDMPKSGSTRFQDTEG